MQHALVSGVIGLVLSTAGAVATWKGGSAYEPKSPRSSPPRCEPRGRPPRILGTVPTYVPRVNADGNETAGVPSVQLQAPLGTYLGWNTIRSGFFAGQGCGFQAAGFRSRDQGRAGAK